MLGFIWMFIGLLLSPIFFGASFSVFYDMIRRRMDNRHVISLLLGCIFLSLLTGPIIIAAILMMLMLQDKKDPVFMWKIPKDEDEK